MDRISKEQRSYNMSQIKYKDTKPEKLIFSILKKAGYNFVRHSKTVEGKPDAIIKKYKIALFVDGEYWHGKDFDKWKNKLSQFWLKKIGGNIKRDKKVNQTLKDQGWTVFRFWGRDIDKNSELILKKLDKKIKEISAD